MNTELFAKIRDMIREHPEQHDQSAWESQPVDECGTTRCVAGWAVALTTGLPVYSWQPGEEIRLSDATLRLAHEKGVYVEDLGDNGVVPALAARLLSLTPNEAGSLFYSEDERAHRAVEKAAAGDRVGFLLALIGGDEDA